MYWDDEEEINKNGGMKEMSIEQRRKEKDTISSKKKNRVRTPMDNRRHTQPH
jgi:hypothetical protein